MFERIVKELEKIEKEHDVKIIFASESGSRAWGFPSQDSDFDVRFVYVNIKDWYLSIENKRDVIELPLEDILDISGWDLRKSLQLMRKSNSPLFEWISSPIQYYSWPEAYESIVNLAEKAFLPETSFHHYLSMAKNSLGKIETRENVNLKMYMYAIRSLLCCQWIKKMKTHPPMQVSDLFAVVNDDDSFVNKVVELIDEKKEHSEKYSVSKSEIIENYLKKAVIELQTSYPKNTIKLDINSFDSVFRKILTESDDRQKGN